jgi:hypothetical protein
VYPADFATTKVEQVAWHPAALDSVQEEMLAACAGAPNPVSRHRAAFFMPDHLAHKFPSRSRGCDPLHFRRSSCNARARRRGRCCQWVVWGYRQASGDADCCSCATDVMLLPTPGLGGALVRRGAKRTSERGGTAKRRQRSAARRAAGSRSALVEPPKQGNSPRRTLGREAKRRPADPGAGNRWGTSRPRSLSTQRARIASGALPGRPSCRLTDRMR